MATVILDADLARQLRAQRAAQGSDRYDEVWEGTYMMAPMPNNEHQRLVSQLTRILEEVIGDSSRGEVFPGVNVSDREADWQANYRVPDVAVFLNNTSAVNRGSYWQGGPDFAVEVVSPDDQSREKLDFYASVNTREFLVLDRDPWQLELYRLSSGSLQLAEVNQPGQSSRVHSEVVGLTFQLSKKVPGDRPQLSVNDPESNRTWTI